MVCVEGKTVQDLHRNDDPCDSEQAHRGARNPTFTEPQTNDAKDQQTRSCNLRRQRGPHVCSQGGIGHDHRHEQALSKPAFTFHGDSRHDVLRRTVICGGRSERRVHVANRSIDVLRFRLNVLLGGRLIVHVQRESGEVQPSGSLEGPLTKEVVLLRFFHAPVLMFGTSRLGACADACAERRARMVC